MIYKTYTSEEVKARRTRLLQRVEEVIDRYGAAEASQVMDILQASVNLATARRGDGSPCRSFWHAPGPSLRPSCTAEGCDSRDLRFDTFGEWEAWVAGGRHRL